MSLSVDIRKNFGSFRLDVRFEAGNEVLGLLGASGCGKSMTLKCIAGIEKPDEGHIILDGITLFDSEKKINLTPQERRVGLLFQNYALFPNMTVYQNIMTGLSREKNKEIRRKKAGEAIEAFYLTGLEKRRPAELSGGQQQRVALARILVSRPGLLMLDEPFSALDGFLRWELELELVRILEEFGGTTLFVSHDRDEVHRLCDRVCVISAGRSEEVMSVREMFQNPKTRSAALLSGCKNISGATRLSEHEVFAKDWGLRFYSEKEVPQDVRYVGVRAKDILVAKEAEAENVAECRIVRVMEEAFYHIYILEPLGAEEGVRKPLRFDMEKHMGGLPAGAKTVRIRVTADNLLFLT
ncbi:MAG: ATP-binding cassette domain-containing protein [Lachnospiraceae bacterium]|nr:ATP-binding cassette domain-containing protein [Lachnospiraceae bacterium]